jgi:gamma-glutamylaminecyclotransferase
MLPTVLFVYGTLKRGERNHHLMAGQRCLGAAITAPIYRVIDLGAHPGLVHDSQNGLSVHGELFEVSQRALKELDEFEGIPEPFDRRPVQMLQVEPIVQAYFWLRPVPADGVSGDHWPLDRK